MAKLPEEIALEQAITNEKLILSTKVSPEDKDKFSEKRLVVLIQTGFCNHREVMHDKIMEMQKKYDKGEHQYLDALKHAKDLYNDLLMHQIDYLISDASENDSINAFKNACDESITKAKKVLDVHRGWKEFLTEMLSLLVHIVTIAPLIIACAQKITTGKTLNMFGLFPKPKTDSAKKVDGIASSLNSMFTNQPPSEDGDAPSMDF